MASSRDRQRKLARAKVERQQARRAERAHRSRQLKAIVGIVLSVALIAVGTTWLLGGFDSKPVSVASDCYWNPQSTEGTQLEQVGTPPATGIDMDGQATMTVAFDTGAAVATLNRDLAPCAVASLQFLAEKGFFNDTRCHELTHADGNFALRCGDRSGTGAGGVAYTFAGENIPSDLPSGTVPYPAGTIAMHTNTSGSQFMIFYKDSVVQTAAYSVVGKITSGLDVIEKIAKAGTVDNGTGADTKPKQDVNIKTLTVVDAPDPAASASTAPSPTVSASTAG